MLDLLLIGLSGVLVVLVGVTLVGTPPLQQLARRPRPSARSVFVTGAVTVLTTGLLFYVVMSWDRQFGALAFGLLIFVTLLNAGRVILLGWGEPLALVEGAATRKNRSARRERKARARTAGPSSRRTSQQTGRRTTSQQQRTRRRSRGDEKEGGQQHHRYSRTTKVTADDVRAYVYGRVLGVSPRADMAEIKAAYRQRVRRWHPDRFAGEDAVARRRAEEQTKRLNEAYAFFRRRAQ